MLEDYSISLKKVIYDNKSLFYCNVMINTLKEPLRLHGMVVTHWRHCWFGSVCRR